MIQGLRLEKLRGKLRDMRDDLRQEIVRRGETIREDVKDPGDITDIPTHEADHDVPDVPREVEVGIIQTTMLDQVESALARIENETYGRCERCGGDIGSERIEAIPYTPHCVECARELERRNPPHPER